MVYLSSNYKWIVERPWAEKRREKSNVPGMRFLGFTFVDLHVSRFLVSNFVPGTIKSFGCLFAAVL